MEWLEQVSSKRYDICIKTGFLLIMCLCLKRWPIVSIQKMQLLHKQRKKWLWHRQLFRCYRIKSLIKQKQVGYSDVISKIDKNW